MDNRAPVTILVLVLLFLYIFAGFLPGFTIRQGSTPGAASSSFQSFVDQSRNSGSIPQGGAGMISNEQTPLSASGNGPSSSAKSGNAIIEYVVLPGDTLYSIAQRFHSSSADIAQRNKLANPNTIYPGQHLQVLDP